MSSKIKRISSTYADLLLTNSLSTTAAVSFDDEASIVLYLPATWTACNLYVHALSPSTSLYYPVIDTAGNAVTIASSVAVASKAIAVPDAIFAATSLKFVTDNAANNAIVVGATSKA